MAEPRVYISYQYSDSPRFAREIYSHLLAAFGRGRVFPEIEVVPGEAQRVNVFVSELVEAADVVVLVIGPAFDLDQLSRPEDSVRMEIEVALQVDSPIVPVLFDDSLMPGPYDLPDELAALGVSRTIRIQPSLDFGQGVRELIEYVRFLTSDQSPGGRVMEMGAGGAAAAVGAFEAPLGALNNLVQDGAFALWDEEFVRNTVQQILLWRERDEANPQIFELLVADVVKRVLDRLTDPAPLRRELLRLGADEHLAEDIAGRVGRTVGEMTDLGGPDPVEDARLLERIAEATDRTAAAVEASDLPKSLTRKAGEAAALGAAGAVGKAGADKGLHLLRELVDDEWPKLQIGLMLGWRAVRDLFVR